MEVCIIGLGLLGGSFSLALKSARKEINVIGVDINPANKDTALRLGIADRIESFEEAVKKADLVVLATPVNVITKQILPALDQIKDKAILIDLGSTKEEVCRIADTHPKRQQYVASHPIAGTENSGPEAAFGALMHHKTMIICDKEKSDTKAIEFMESMYKSLDMRIAYMPSVEHDQHIAFVSHLSHITSFALGATVLDKEKDEKSIFTMAGSGFSSTVRLAKSSPEMWAPIFTQNQKNISVALEAYIAKLKQFKKILDSNDEPSSYNLMKEANDIRRVLSGISKNDS